MQITISKSIRTKKKEREMVSPKYRTTETQKLPLLPARCLFAWTVAKVQTMRSYNALLWGMIS